MIYSQAINYLNSLSNYEQDKKTCSFNLKKIRNFLQTVGNPQRNFLSVHIAGSNGKGAVGNFIYSALKEEGYKVGFFSSPHLISIKERIRISWLNSSAGLFKDTIPRKDFADLIDKIARIEKKNKNKLSFFETLTAAAFLYFTEQKVDLAIIETGLGGRLDATNVVKPLLCVFTPITLEHCEELGNTLSEIAGEKAGIIKKGCCVISALQKEEVREVIRRRCKEKDARLFKVAAQSNPQTENIFLSLKVLEKLKPRFSVSQRAIKRGFKSAYWPGRLERISIARGSKKYQILLDGAHNIAATEFLKKTIEKQFSSTPLEKSTRQTKGSVRSIEERAKDSLTGSTKIVLIFSACKDKNIEGMSRVIFPLCKRIIFTHFKNSRCETIAGLKKRSGYQGERARNIKEALNLAYKAASANTLILISGSLYLVGETMQLFQNAYGIYQK